MPKRNAVKVYGAEQYYHVYNRGASKMDIFRAPEDYGFLLGLFKKYLGAEKVRKDGHSAPNYGEIVDLVAYCLMPNHYHLLLYNKQADGMEKLMRSVMTAYSMYYNRKYNRTGVVFEGRYLASRITSDEYLWHVSRYIHLNPVDIYADPLKYPYSSIGYFQGSKQASWLRETWLVETGADRQRYVDSVTGDIDYHYLMHTVRNQLAHMP